MTAKEITGRRLQLALESAERELTARWAEAIRLGLDALKRWEAAPEGGVCEAIAALDYKRATKRIAAIQAEKKAAA